MIKAIVHVIVLGFAILFAIAIWRSAFNEHVLSKREAVVGSVASIVSAGLAILMGVAKSVSLLPLVLILWLLVVFIAAKALRATYVRERMRRGDARAILFTDKQNEDGEPE